MKKSGVKLEMKKFFQSVLCLCLFFPLAGKAQAKKDPILQLDFSKPVNVELKNKAVIQDNVLRLNGNGAYIQIPGSEKFHLTTSGMTIAMTLRMNSNETKSGNHNSHDAFCSKGKEFSFARNKNQLYFNFHNGKEWCATTIGGKVPLDKKWNHYILSVEYFEDKAQGDMGFKIAFYINGELEYSRRINNIMPFPLEEKIALGNGFGGGPWFFDGEIANFTLYDRPINEAEAAEMARSEKLVKIVRDGFVDVSEEFNALKKSFDKSAPISQWVSSALYRALSQGIDQQKAQKAYTALKQLRDVKDLDTFARKFNKAQKDFALVVTSRTIYLTATGSGRGTHPLLGMYDRNMGREVFGERTLFWKIIFRDSKGNQTVSSWSPSVSWKNRLEKDKLHISWEGTAPLKFTASSEVELKDGRIESTFELKNHSPNYIVDQVFYPQYAFSKLPGEKDFLAYPYMSGVEVANPTVERFIWGQSGRYPSGSVVMQFGAYYDEKNGIYFGFEDPLGRTKNFSVSGKRSNLYVDWNHPVAVKVGAKGGNHFCANGKAVIELYGDGGWYGGGQVYRRFLEQKARWWIKELPRKSTPAWFRNNTLWLLCTTLQEADAEELAKKAAFFRGYLELPFGIHWYRWNDEKIASMPHFPEKSFTRRINKQIRASGVYTIPYIDDRLWAQLDGPEGKSDYMYKSHGQKYAARDRQGKVYTETYGKKIDSIMCPAVAPWRKFMVDLMIRIADTGFDGVYHDQVATARPRMCFTESHGHLLNDPALWLEQGYWPMFADAFKVLRSKYPNFCHTTEENAEPYLQEMDGYMVWRWTDAGQIPLFQSIYSGRAQFVGRLFGGKPGDRQSFFSKVAQQLVNAEQIGWFGPYAISRADERRLYVKKAMHVRLALLEYFNEGRMLAPIKFDSMPKDRSKWSGNAPQIVVMPQIANSAWLGPDGTKMYLFTNTQWDKNVSVTPLIQEEKGFWICREGKEKPVYVKKAPRLYMTPLTFEVWVCGTRQKAEKIQETLKKISTFDAGQEMQQVMKFKTVRHTGVPGKLYTAKDVAGLSNCNATVSKSHIGWINDGALISFGEVDFGNRKITEITIKAAVHASRAGGSIDLITQRPGVGQGIAGSLDLTDTGGWKVFKEFKMKLRYPLTGKQDISFYINGSGACNFAGWKF